MACDEALANEAAAAAQAIRDDCENDLAEAIPALQVSPLYTNVVKKKHFISIYLFGYASDIEYENH